MSSKYWPPASLATEGNTSDIGEKYFHRHHEWRPKDAFEMPHCCVWFDGSVIIDEGFMCCQHCLKKVLDTDEEIGYSNTMKGWGSPAP